MKLFSRILAVVAISACLAVGTAYATPITGAISISGSVDLNSEDLSLATGALSGRGLVTSASGSFSGTMFSLVQYYPFYWNPSNAPINPLWSFTFGGKTYSFALDSISVVKQTDYDLILSGAGMLHIDGFTDTPGAWRYSVNNSSGEPQSTFDFGFTSSDNVALVPDTSSTALLLVVGFAAIVLTVGARRTRRA